MKTGFEIDSLSLPGMADQTSVFLMAMRNTFDGRDLLELDFPASITWIES